MRPDFPDVSSRYGASMGRSESYFSIIPAGRLRIYRVPIDSGGYDPGGAYWGHGAPLYCIESEGIGHIFQTETSFAHYYRAADRADAYCKMALKFGGPHPLKRSI